jgi:hypothetical protein
MKHQPQDDPELALWADSTLAPLRRQMAEVDVAGSVMSRIAATRPRPVPSLLPERWQRPAWAATLAAGLAAFLLLSTTAVLMLANGDEGARTAMTLAATGWTLLMHGLGAAWGVVRALAETAFLFGRGGWTILDTASPLVRAAGVFAAFCGAASIAFSALIVSRAQRQAPLAARASWNTLNGGFS